MLRIEHPHAGPPGGSTRYLLWGILLWLLAAVPLLYGLQDTIRKAMQLFA